MDILENIKESIAETIDSMESIIYTFLFILVLALYTATAIAPIVLCIKYNQSYLWFLTYLVTIPLVLVIGVFMYNWGQKVN